MINVIIPAYNCSKTLGRTLASLVAQTDQNFEVIIIDDYSTENIKNIIDDYNNKLKIVYIRNEKNIGCGMSRQVGIDNATQKFITFLDSDDCFMPYTVETFNSIIEANPDIEYLHSYFYEQVSIEGNPSIILYKDNYTACHGKLYNLDLIKKFGICNSPDIKWADDSYFNSMCSELLNMSIIKIPTVLWCNNMTSILRKKDSKRDAEIAKDFLNAMLKSAEFVLQYKDSIAHIQNTFNTIINNESLILNDDEKRKIDKLLTYARRNFDGNSNYKTQ